MNFNINKTYADLESSDNVILFEDTHNDSTSLNLIDDTTEIITFNKINNHKNMNVLTDYDTEILSLDKNNHNTGMSITFLQQHIEYNNFVKTVKLSNMVPKSTSEII